MDENTQPDDEYLNECLKELGIDLSEPKKKSRLPRNRLGIPVLRGGVRTKDITEWDAEFWM